MIRPAVQADIPQIVELGIEALSQDAYEELLISREKVFHVVTECVRSGHNFSWVAEQDGVVLGAVGALVTPMIFHERSQASVVMYFCKIPGEGIKMLRELMRWVKTRPSIKMVEFTLERNHDPRIPKLLKRLGLTESLPIYVQMR